jgi:uncharacterized protein YndB with AHSA1/START domain
MKLAILLAGLALVLSPRYATAEIADSAANGFTYKTTLTIKAPSDVVYRRILEVGNWWNSSHTFSGDAHNLSMDARPMGCWCEKLPEGGGVRHMEFVLVVPGKMLVLTGGLGPLQSMAATGTMKFVLSPTGGDTKLEFTYTVGGYLPAGMNSLASPVDGVLTQQFTRLKTYIETGSPVPKQQP